MTMKRTADHARQESEHIVMRELAQKSPQRWSDLLKNTQISSRTLKKTLNRLEGKGLLFRTVEQNNEYPPPVFYGLSSKGRKSGEPLLFATSARPYVLGANVQWKVVHESSQKEPEARIHITPEKENMKDRIALIGKRLGALYLFAFLKALENGNIDWLRETEGLLVYDPFVALVFGFKFSKLDDSTSTAKVESVDGELLVPIPRIADIPKQEEIKKLKNLVEQVYPEEIKTFEEILSNHKAKKRNDGTRAHRRKARDGRR